MHSAPSRMVGITLTLLSYNRKIIHNLPVLLEIHHNLTSGNIVDTPV